MTGCERHLLRLLTSALRSCAALDPLGLWLIDMMRRDPALVVCRCLGSHGWSIGSDNGDLISWINLLRLAGRFLGAFAAFASTALLGKECTDPGAVDEIACASKASGEEEVKEDAIVGISEPPSNRQDFNPELTFVDQRY